jgi:hypothetical protein
VNPWAPYATLFCHAHDLTAALPVAPGHSNSPRWQLIDSDATKKNIDKA